MLTWEYVFYVELKSSTINKHTYMIACENVHALLNYKHNRLQ